MAARKIKNYQQTHLYSYAYFCWNRFGGISAESRATMKAKCLRLGHTEAQCAAVERDPKAFIFNGQLAD